MDEEIKYKKGNFIVTNRQFKTPKRTYQLSKIEKVELKRPAFLMSLPIGSLLIALSFSFSSCIIPFYIRGISFALGVVAILSCWSIGTLYLHSRTLSDSALTFDMGTLRGIREAIEESINERELKESQRNEF
mgnify:CR=1 FL=1|jgi:hypothetical protein